jgi:hypothetical protein
VELKNLNVKYSAWSEWSLIVPQVPVNLLRTSRIFTFEPPPGVKANLVRTFSTVPAARMCKEPHERARLYFLLAWFHAIIQERLRYAPQGWTKKYEFNESDLKMACDTLDTWLESVAQVGVATVKCPRTLACLKHFIKPVLILTVSHRTFSDQFKHFSGQFFPLSDQINTSSYGSNTWVRKYVRTFLMDF